jgi:hypothetical protein
MVITFKSNGNSDIKWHHRVRVGLTDEWITVTAGAKVWKPVGLGNLSPHLGAGFGRGAGGVPERAEVHVGAGLDDPTWQALGAGLPAPPARRSSAPATPFPPPLRGRGGV